MLVGAGHSTVSASLNPYETQLINCHEAALLIRIQIRRT